MPPSGCCWDVCAVSQRTGRSRQMRGMGARMQHPRQGRRWAPSGRTPFNQVDLQSLLSPQLPPPRRSFQNLLLLLSCWEGARHHLAGTAILQSASEKPRQERSRAPKLTQGKVPIGRAAPGFSRRSSRLPGAAGEHGSAEAGPVRTTWGWSLPPRGRWPWLNPGHSLVLSRGHFLYPHGDPGAGGALASHFTGQKGLTLDAQGPPTGTA